MLYAVAFVALIVGSAAIHLLLRRRRNDAYSIEFLGQDAQIKGLGRQLDILGDPPVAPTEPAVRRPWRIESFTPTVRSRTYSSLQGAKRFLIDNDDFPASRIVNTDTGQHVDVATLLADSQPAGGSNQQEIPPNG